jgi:DNA-binding transcriptional regulator YiaG
MARGRRHWSAARVRDLRRALGLTQQGLADELGVRQQTVSEWETGAYLPRGASVRLLDIVAERAAAYDTASEAESGPSSEPAPEADRDP